VLAEGLLVERDGVVYAIAVLDALVLQVPGVGVAGDVEEEALDEVILTIPVG